VLKILAANISFSDKEDARGFFYELRQTMLDLNGTPEQSDMFAALYKKNRRSAYYEKCTL